MATALRAGYNAGVRDAAKVTREVGAKWTEKSNTAQTITIEGLCIGLATDADQSATAIEALILEERERVMTFMDDLVVSTIAMLWYAAGFFATRYCLDCIIIWPIRSIHAYINKRTYP